jgi:hypothetical protein
MFPGLAVKQPTIFDFPVFSLTFADRRFSPSLLTSFQQNRAYGCRGIFSGSAHHSKIDEGLFISKLYQDRQ